MKLQLSLHGAMRSTSNTGHRRQNRGIGQSSIDSTQSLGIHHGISHGNHFVSQQSVTHPFAASVSHPTTSRALPTTMRLSSQVQPIQQTTSHMPTHVVLFDTNGNPFQIPSHFIQRNMVSHQSLYTGSAHTHSDPHGAAVSRSRMVPTMQKAKPKSPAENAKINEKMMKTLHVPYTVVKNAPQNKDDTSQCPADQHGKCTKKGFCGDFRKALAVNKIIKFVPHFVCEHPDHGPGGKSLDGTTPYRVLKHEKSMHPDCLLDDGTWYAFHVMCE